MKQSVSRAHAILHVVRARIIVALSDRTLTPRDLVKILGDVPLGTLYRHLNTLLEAEIIEIVAERRVHGTVERTFGMRPGASYLSLEDRTNLTPEELTGIVQMLTMVVTDAFGKFASVAPRPYKEGQFTMVTEGLYLTQNEICELRDFIRATVAKSGRGPAPDLERRIVGFFSVPDLSEQMITNS